MKAYKTENFNCLLDYHAVIPLSLVGLHIYMIGKYIINKRYELKHFHVNLDIAHQKHFIKTNIDYDF